MNMMIKCIDNYTMDFLMQLLLKFCEKAQHL